MNRLRVIVLQEASVDGKLAMRGDRPLLYGDQHWDELRGSMDLDLFQWLKEKYPIGATLEGSNSFVRAEDAPDPLPPFFGDPEILYQDYLPDNILYREGHRGWFIAVDSLGRVRWKYKDGYPGDETWKGWHLLVLVSGCTPSAYLAYLQQEEIPYLVTGEVKVDLAKALAKVKNRLGVEVLVSTAGGVLNGLLMKAGLVDEINIKILPGIIGGREAPSLFAGHVLDPEDGSTRLALISCSSQPGGQVWLRYNVLQNRDSNSRAG